MSLKSRLNYDQAPNHGQSADLSIAFRDKIFRGIVEDLESIAATGGGDVYGPASAVDDRIATFDGTTGKLIQDGGQTIADLSIGVLVDLYPDAITVDAATTGVLAGAPTYANGAGGVGATLTRGSNGVFPTIDGHAAALNNTYLVKNQAAALQNGVYELTTLGSGSVPWVLTRTTNSDQTAEFDPQVVIPANGSTNQRKIFNQTTVTPTVGTSNIVYSQTTTVALVISRTVAQMQALVAASTVVPGQLYRITNAAVAQGTCVLIVRGHTSTTLETTGYGSFKNAIMAVAVNAEIDYDLTTDFISRVTREYDAANTSLPVTVTDKGNGAIALFRFDDTVNFSNSYLENPVIANLSGIIAGCRLGEGCTIDLQNSSQLGGIVAGITNNFQLGATAGSSIVEAQIGDSNSFILPDAVAFQHIFIGSGKIIDTSSFATGYSPPVGCVYIGNKSTFPVTQTENAACTEAGGQINLASMAFCGIFYPVDTDTGTITDIANAPTDHDFEFRANALGGNLVFTDSVTNVYNGGGLNITLTVATEDWVSYRTGQAINTNVYQIDAQTY